MFKRLTYVMVAGASFCGLVFAVQADKAMSVKTMPPVVVKTVPMSGDTAVDATKVTEIRVTFSKEMADKSWSWAEVAGGTALPVKGDVKYDADGKTCVATVTLEPGKTYATWINSEKFGNFKDKDGRSAVPYLLVV